MKAFEYKKWCKSYKNISILIVILFMILFNFYKAVKTERIIRKNHIIEIEKIYNELDLLKNQVVINMSDSSEESTKYNEKIVKLYDSALENLDNHYIQYKQNNWYDYTSYYNNYLQNILTIQEQGGQIIPPDEDIQTLINRNQYLLNKKIEPVSMQASTKSLYFMKTIIDFFFSYIGILLLILLFYDLYTKEYENNTIKLLYLLPINIRKINLEKFSFSFLLASLIPFIIIVISILISFIYSKQLGDVNYPIFINYEDGQYVVVSLIQYLIKSILFFELVIITLLSLIYIISEMTKDYFLTLTTTLFLMEMPTIFINELYYRKKETQYVPFYYVNLYDKSQHLDIKNTVFYSMNPFFISLFITVVCLAIFYRIGLRQKIYKFNN